MKRNKILIAYVLMAIVLTLVACGKTPEASAKIKFDYSMSALTVAIERSYSKVTGRVSSAVLHSDALDQIPKKIESPQEEYPHQILSLYSIRITGIYEFGILGDFEHDVITEYCGNGPYRIILAKYNRTYCEALLTRDSNGVHERYRYLEDSTPLYYLIVEGINSGELFFNRVNGVSYSDDSVPLSMDCLLFSYADGLLEKQENVLPEENSKREKILIEFDSQNSEINLICQDEGEYRNKYHYIAGSFRSFPVNEHYTVAELALPVWYSATAVS